MRRAEFGRRKSARRGTQCADYRVALRPRPWPVLTCFSVPPALGVVQFGCWGECLSSVIHCAVDISRISKAKDFGLADIHQSIGGWDA